MKIFDSHAHYFDKRFDTVEGGAHGILSSIMPDPVAAVINVGTDCQSSRTAIAQAAEYDGMYAAAGIHPGDCHYAKDPDAALAELESLLCDRAGRKKDKLVALGEIGLDYHWPEYGGIPMSKERQLYFFHAQMQMARHLSIPVIIHDREAHGDCMDVIMQYPDVRGVFHSYSGSAEMAKDLCRRGWYVSFSGTLTFKNAERVRAAALAVPRDRLLIETDAPYLAPHPVRGSMNHSGLLPYTLTVLASLWDISPDEAANITFENAKKLFLEDLFG